jgi:AraC family transcriptional regulator, transcriptional activator of pobA
MKRYYEDRLTNGRFTLIIRDGSLGGKGLLNDKADTTNTIVYNAGPVQQVVIDEIVYNFPPNTVLTLMVNQHFRFETPEQLIAWQFNREFYCIADHDAEVGCVGFLFYGIQHPFFLTLTASEQQNVLAMERLCEEDMDVKDNMQGEMLRTLLKRLIIHITRIAKRQAEPYQQLSEERMDMVRKFNLLLEAHFRTQHEVQFYAQAMNKSPKTLANIFGLCNYSPPSRLIHRRIILEAKRFLHYTDKPAKEVAAELGFASAAHFSRFFKLHTGVNFSRFKSDPVTLSSLI